MQHSLRGYGIAVLITWIVLCIAAGVYSQSRGVPDWVTYAVVPAFLVEAALYIGSGLQSVRSRLEQLPPYQLAGWMTASAPLPYLIYSIASGVFDVRSALTIIALSAVLAGWFLLFRPSIPADIGFLFVLAAPWFLKVFKELYPDPVPRLSLHVLGTLMWARLGLLALLSIRKLEGVGFGFIPARSDWKIGIRNFALFMPIGYLLAVWLGFIRPVSDDFGWSTIALALITFIITLWVLAVAEEFFFRGFLQQLVKNILGNELLALVIVAAIFAALHLWYRDFPNWRFSILVFVAGLFYGRAFVQARSIRAAMVTHALVVTTWRVFLF